MGKILSFNHLSVRSLALLFLICLPAFDACSSSGGVRYEFRGVVRSVDKQNRRATIAHEAIKDHMEAMTMPFSIRDDAALNKIQPGDRIKATLVEKGYGQQWLEDVVIIQ